MSRGKVSLGTQAPVIEALGACPSQTTAHTCTAPVQAPLSQLVLEWDSGVEERTRNWGVQGWPTILQDLTRVLQEGWGYLCVFVGKVGGGGRKAACGGEGFLANTPVS